MFNIFDRFLASGGESSSSPFIATEEHFWGKGIGLKASGLAAIFLLGAWITHFYSPALSNFLVTFVYFFSGTPALINTLEAIGRKEINIDILMTVAAVFTIVIGSPLEGGLLLVLFTLSTSLEKKVAEKTRGAVADLQQASKSTTLVFNSEQQWEPRHVQDLRIDDQVLVKAGEMVPVDGLLLYAPVELNISHLTGESLPITFEVGALIPAGAITFDEPLIMQVTHLAQDSTLNRLISLISQAQESKPKIQRTIERFGKYYSSTILLIALAMAIYLSFYLQDHQLGVYKAIVFLIAASPCALILATPSAYLSAITSCTKEGILLKDGSIFDAMSQSSNFLFDKTGTLTTGALVCIEQNVVPIDPQETTITAQDALMIAASLEEHSTHPIANALVMEGKKQKSSPLLVENCKNFSGRGIEAFVTLPSGDKSQVYLGSEEYIALRAYCKSALQKIPRRSDKRCFLHVGNSIAIFYFSDPVRAEASEVISQLHQKKLKTFMVTGDRDIVAQKIAKTVGISNVYANLSPEEKLKTVASMQETVMIGDGINDGPALARATVGIAMGTIASAAAITQCGAIFLRENLDLLIVLLNKSKKTVRIIQQNIFTALLLISINIGLTICGISPLWLTVVLHEGGTVCIVLNSLRLLRQSARLKTNGF